MADAKPELMIGFDPGSDPLSGRGRNQTGERRSFVGWLGLAHAVGRALEDDAEPRHDPARKQATGARSSRGAPPMTRSAHPLRWLTATRSLRARAPPKRGS